jgi:hypothetical protein
MSAFILHTRAHACAHTCMRTCMRAYEHKYCTHCICIGVNVKFTLPYCLENVNIFAAVTQDSYILPLLTASSLPPGAAVRVGWAQRSCSALLTPAADLCQIWPTRCVLAETNQSCQSGMCKNRRMRFTNQSMIDSLNNHQASRQQFSSVTELESEQA